MLGYRSLVAARLTPEQRKARIRAALARTAPSVQKDYKGSYKPPVAEPVKEPTPEPDPESVVTPGPVTTPKPIVGDKPEKPTTPPITSETIRRGVQQRHMQTPNYKLHVLAALTVAFLIQGLATGWGTIKTGFAKTTGVVKK